MENQLNEANKILGTNYQNWKFLSMHRKLTENFIQEFANKLDWGKMSRHQNLSEDFIRKFADRVNWVSISYFQRLSENFIREFKDRVSWYYISISQILSENFIREFADKICWSYISKYQHLSEGFIKEFKDKVDWYYISRHQILSKEFIEEFNNNNRVIMKLVTASWNYKSTEEKKKAVIDTGLYECHEDYFIAYKGIRTDRYSKFNFQYQYLKGHTYETWCDCSANENSFGFSAWTEDEARDYCNELIVRVKVRYEDVGRVVHKGGKIRCFKLEVLD